MSRWFDPMRWPRELRAIALLAAAVLTLTTSPQAHASGESSPTATSASTLKLPSGPASVRGLAGDAPIGMLLGSTFSGQVSYSVPIEMPPGPAGNGVVGVGWSMSAPQIKRSTRHGIPTFTEADELELVGLGGGRLFPYGDGTFRAEGKGNAIKVELLGANYRDGFKVTSSDGKAPVRGSRLRAP